MHPLGHPADIPVTDLDDNDDEIMVESAGPRDRSLFRNSSLASASASTDNLPGQDIQADPLVPSYDPDLTLDQAWLDDLDYTFDGGPEEGTFAHTVDRWIPDSVKSLWHSRSNRSNTYEMVAPGSLPFPGSHDEQARTRGRQLSRYLGRAILVSVVCLLLILGVKWQLKSQKWHASGPPPATLLSNGTHDFHRTTILISLDGFHPHYINKRNTPALHEMLVAGHGAPYMRPAFPSSTFPNHWTLVTGLWPSEHGIVGNTFYDPVLNRQFVNTDASKGALDPDFWQGGEPVWNTLARQGLSTGVHMWPGSEVRGGVGPDHDFDMYNGTEPLGSKASRIFSWLDRPSLKTRPELVLTYVPTIDQVGHKHGISGPQLTLALNEVDGFVGLVQQMLMDRNLSHIVNLIIVSDHGMAPTSPSRLLFLDDVVDTSKVSHIDGWPLNGLRPANGVSVDELHDLLLANMTDSDRTHFQVYRLEDFPAEYHFGGSPSAHRFNYRLAPLWIVPEVGYSITNHATLDKAGGDYLPHGVHGYNNSEVTMRALFLGTGPYFDARLQPGLKVLPFDNVEVYNIVCESVGAVPGPNNGTNYHDGSTAVSARNVLPPQWPDPLGFPNLPFDTAHIVENATYDSLYAFSHPEQPNPPHPDQATLPQPDQLVPSPYSSDLAPGTNVASAPSSVASKNPLLPEKTSSALDKITDQIEQATEDAENAWDDSDAKNWLQDTLKGAGDWLQGVFGGSKANTT